MKRKLLWALGVVVVLALFAPLIRQSAPVLTVAHRDAIEALHQQHAWTRPTALEVSDVGNIVTVTYELPADAGGTARGVAEARLLAIRELLLPSGFTSFRVNINGPSPGTGLVRRFGSARFLGDKLEWLTP